MMGGSSSSTGSGSMTGGSMGGNTSKQNRLIEI